MEKWKNGKMEQNTESQDSRSVADLRASQSHGLWTLHFWKCMPCRSGVVYGVACSFGVRVSPFAELLTGVIC